MSFIFLIGAALLGLVAVFGPEIRVHLRHRRARRAWKLSATRRPK